MTSTPLTVLYDANCGFCNRTALVLRRLDRRRRLRLVSLQAAESRLPAAPSQDGDFQKRLQDSLDRNKEILERLAG